MKKITKRWLKRHDACCSDADMDEAEKIGNPEKIIEKLVENARYKDAYWLITRMLSKKKNRQYAIFCAELVLPIFEKEYPNNNRPRKAIEAAKICLKNPTKENIIAARAAADAAAYTAYAAARAAVDSAYAAAARAADVVDAKTKQKIIKYGLSLLKGE